VVATSSSGQLTINGVISYNTTSLYRGILFREIRLEVKEGKVVKATAPAFQKELDEIFNTDAGARYFGEFAIGVNPYVLELMNDTLFDEKIKGSIHLTPGNSYDDCDNGNKSAIHWDLVLIQRETHGGGEIYFDGKLVRKNGVFVLDELKGLNFA
jgi:aminopeptidase